MQLVRLFQIFKTLSSASRSRSAWRRRTSADTLLFASGLFDTWKVMPSTARAGTHSSFPSGTCSDMRRMASLTLPGEYLTSLEKRRFIESGLWGAVLVLVHVTYSVSPVTLPCSCAGKHSRVRRSSRSGRSPSAAIRLDLVLSSEIAFQSRRSSSQSPSLHAVLHCSRHNVFPVEVRSYSCPGQHALEPWLCRIRHSAQL